MKNYFIAAVYVILIAVGIMTIAVVNGFDPYRYVDGPKVVAERLPLPKPARVSVTHPKPLPKLNYKSWDCLTKNLYFEARGESDEGMTLVGLVVMQRVKSDYFPDTVCGVVYQSLTDIHGNVIRDRCQFSWYCDGNSDKLNFNRRYVRQQWDRAKYIALNILTHNVKENNIDMHGVTFYHAKYVDPYWAHSSNYKLVVTVGNHMFYRWKKATEPKYQSDNNGDNVTLN